jgi:putative ABC transport system ATP-binding protein
VSDPVSPPQKPLAACIRGVTRSFGDGGTKLLVLKGVDLDVRCGDITMLVGPSGCGKTTLISIIAGTLAADDGQLEVFGNDLRKMSKAAITRFRAHTIGFIFQQFNLIPTLSVAENVSVPLLIQGYSSGFAIKRSREILEKVGLGERWKERPNKLSGGQQQRVAIARALIHEPALVICDEPTAALDAHNGEIVLELFREVARSAKRAVIIVTHDNRILSYADRIARMDDGEIVEVTEQNQQRTQHFIHEHAH